MYLCYFIIIVVTFCYCQSLTENKCEGCWCCWTLLKNHWLTNWTNYKKPHCLSVDSRVLRLFLWNISFSIQNNRQDNGKMFSLLLVVRNTLRRIGMTQPCWGDSVLEQRLDCMTQPYGSIAQNSCINRLQWTWVSLAHLRLYSSIGTKFPAAIFFHKYLSLSHKLSYLIMGKRRLETSTSSDVWFRRDHSDP